MGALPSALAQMRSTGGVSACNTLASAGTVLIACVFAIVYRKGGFNSGYQGVAPWDESLSSRPVARVRWADVVAPNGAISEALFERGEPVIITGSPAARWRATALWNPRYVSQHVSELRNVYASTNPVFLYYHDDEDDDTQRKIRQHRARGWRESYTLVDMPTRQFFRTCERLAEPGQLSNGTFVYYSANLEQWSGNSKQDITNDVPRGEAARAFAVPAHMARVDAEQEALVWLGCDQVTASFHYDTVHNFFVQLQGDKLWALLPPTAHSHVYMHPRTHPSWTQSRILDPSRVDDKVFPRFATITGARTARLGPGEVLYVPPVWFHAVRASGTVASLSLWTDAIVYDQIQTAFASPLPFEADWSPQRRVLSAAYYISQLLFVLRPRSARAVAAAALETRHLRTASADAIDVKALGLPVGSICGAPADAELAAKFQKYARDTAKLFADMRPDGVSELKMIDFIEDVASWAASIPGEPDVDTSDNVPRLLAWTIAHCF